MQNYKMEIAYDGRRYKGFRKVKADPDKTIQGKFEAILNKLYGVEIEVTSAVNTNAGVHAKHQVLNFKAPDDSKLESTLYHYFEEFLPDDIIVLSLVRVDDRFHARYNVSSVTYEYRLWKSDAGKRPLFERQLVNVMTDKLNVKGMIEASKIFEGEHDFTAFSTKSKAKSSTKTLTSVSVEESDKEIVITMTGNGFLLNMERIIAGTLIQVGLGQKTIDGVHRGFKTRDPKDAGHKAMAHASCLLKVEY